jgi:hypothetical protein
MPAHPEAIEALPRMTEALAQFGAACERNAETLRRVNARIHDTMNDWASRRVLRAMFPPNSPE